MLWLHPPANILPGHSRARLAEDRQGNELVQRRLPMNDPEIPVLDRVTVVLEKDRKWIGALGLSRSRFVDQFDTVMHLTSVKHHGDFCRGRFFPSLIDPC